MNPFAFSPAVLASGSALAAETYHVENVMLLQPDFMLQERVRVDELAQYIRAVNAAAKASLENVADPAPSSGFLVMAVRPGGRSRAWLDFTPPLAHATADELRSAVERVTPFQANEGRGGLCGALDIVGRGRNAAAGSVSGRMEAGLRFDGCAHRNQRTGRAGLACRGC